MNSAEYLYRVWQEEGSCPEARLSSPKWLLSTLPNTIVIFVLWGGFVNSKKMNRFFKGHFIVHLSYNNGPRVNVQFMGGEAKIKPLGFLNSFSSVHMF